MACPATFQPKADHTNTGSGDNLFNHSEAGARVDDNGTNDSNSTLLCGDLLECGKEASACHYDLQLESLSPL